MKNQNQNTTAEAIRTAYELPEIQTAIALRARHQTSGQKLITELQNAAHADQNARNAAAIVERAGEHWKQAAAAEEAAKALRAIANDTNRTKDERSIARAAASAQERTAAKHRRTAEAIEDEALDRTFSDRADLAQEAAAAALVPYIITPEEYTTAAKANPDSTPAEVFAAAWNNHTFTAGITAAGKAIDNERHHSAHNSEITTKHLASPEELQTWHTIHGNNSGKGYKVAVGRDGINYLTLEYLTYKRKPSGWYIIHHQKTTAARISLEAFTEDSHGAEAELVTNGGIPFIETQEAAERVQAMIDRANLTARERDFLRYFLSARAIHAGELAAQTYRAEHGKKATRSGASRANYGGRLEAAYNHIGVYTAEARKKFLQRLRARATEAAKVEQGCTTPAEAAEAERRTWERLQRNSRRQSRHTESAAAVDALAWTDTAAAVLEFIPGKMWIARAAKSARAAAEVITGTAPAWKPGDPITVTRYYTDRNGNRKSYTEVVTMAKTARAAEAITPGIDYRAAEVLSRDSYRQTAPKAQPPEMTARERRERERLAARDAETAALIAKYKV